MEEHVVFLDRRAIRVPLRAPTFPHRWAEYPHTPPDAVVERLHGDDRHHQPVPIDGATLDTVPTLRLIAVSVSRYEHVDVAACRARGSAVYNVRS